MEWNVLSTHEQALKFRARRNEVLASNIANADTPGYKARDLDFSSVLKRAQGSVPGMRTTSELHLGAARGLGPARTSAMHASAAPAGAASYATDLKFRVPTQPTLDGNSVETDVEQAAFAENALRYRASLRFLDGQIRSIRYALKGGD